MEVTIYNESIGALNNNNSLLGTQICRNNSSQTLQPQENMALQHERKDPKSKQPARETESLQESGRCHELLRSFDTCQSASLATIAVALFFALTLHVLSQERQEDGMWSDHTSHQCEDFCENVQQCDLEIQERGVMQQPINAWTSFAYLLVGLLPLIHRSRNTSTILFFLSNAYLFFGSFWFHACICTFWNHVDTGGMYTTQLTLVGHGFHAVTGVSWCPWIALPILTMAVTIPFIVEDLDAIGLNATNVLIINVSLILLFVVILIIAQAIAAWRQRNSVNATQKRHQEQEAASPESTTTFSSSESVSRSKSQRESVLDLLCFSVASRIV